MILKACTKIFGDTVKKKEQCQVPSHSSSFFPKTRKDAKPHRWWWFSVNNEWEKFWKEEMGNTERVSYRTPLFIPKGSLLAIRTIKDVHTLFQKYGKI